MVMFGNLFFRGVMHAENFYPIVLEVEFVSLRGDLHGPLRRRGAGEQQDGRQEAEEWHCVFLLNGSCRSPFLNVDNNGLRRSLNTVIKCQPQAYNAAHDLSLS